MKTTVLIIALLFGCTSDSDIEVSQCTESPDDCTGDTICMRGICETALPREFQFADVHVTVPLTNPFSGLPWDVDSPPDMYVIAASGARLTSTVWDSYTAEFPGPLHADLVGGSFQLDIYDDDLLTEDSVVRCQSSPVTAMLVRTRTMACQGYGFTVTTRLIPQDVP